MAFNAVEFGSEIQALQKGAYKQTALLVVDVSSVFNDQAFDIPAGATMLALLPRVLDQNNNEQLSATDARVYIKLNATDGIGMAFSLIANSGDNTLLGGPMIKLLISNLTAHAGEKLYFLLGTGIALASAVGGVSGGGYSPALGSGAGSSSGTGTGSVSGSGNGGNGGGGGGGGPLTL